MERDAKRMLLEYNKETKRLDDLYRCAAKQCGISECAFWILYTLRAEERQFTQAEICEFLIEPKQTVHSALKKLEAEGYLARTSSADLRSKHVALTEKGEQFARTWIDRVPEAETAALGAMPEEECAAFVRGAAFVLPAAGGRVPRERRNLRGRAYLKKEGMPRNAAKDRDEKDANSTF